MDTKKNNRPGLECKIEKKVIAKGRIVENSTQTIDTGDCPPLRINEEYSVPISGKRIIATTIPTNVQTETEINATVLFDKKETQRRKLCIIQPLPWQKITPKQRIMYNNVKQRNNTQIISLHEYYTPKSIEIQAFLAIITIFVDYDNFYVNIIM